MQLLNNWKWNDKILLICVLLAIGVCWGTLCVLAGHFLIGCLNFTFAGMAVIFLINISENMRRKNEVPS